MNARNWGRLQRPGEYNFRDKSAAATVMTLDEFLADGSAGCIDTEGLRDERIQEFEASGQWRLAGRLRRCKKGWRCDMRHLCPSCGAQDSAAKARRVVWLIENMQHRIPITVSCFASLIALPKTATLLVKWIGTLRKRRSFTKQIAGGVGGLEMKLANHRHGWAVHVHLVLDARQQPLDVEGITQDWRRITGGRGRIMWESKGGRRSTAEDLANYMTKPDCWSGQRLHGVALRAFVLAVYRRHHLIGWGTGSRRSATGRTQAQPGHPGGGVETLIGLTSRLARSGT